MRTPKGNGIELSLSPRRRERVCEGFHGVSIDGFPQHNWQIVRDDVYVRVVECVRCGKTVTHKGRTQ